MPAVMEYLEPNDKNRDGIESTISGERSARERAYNKSKRYYDGDMRRFLDVKEGEPDDNVVINLVHMAVDRTISFLFPQMPELELSPREADQTPDEKWLEEAWDENGGLAKLTDAALNGALSGQAYIRIYPARTNLGEKYPRIAVLDPRSIITYWKADDKDTVLWHEISWSVPYRNITRHYLQDIVFLPEEGIWKILQYIKTGNSRWKLDASDDWRFSLGPITYCKHLNNPSDFYGKSETGNIGLNDKVNLIFSEAARINRYHASPKTVATGVGEGEVQETAIDEMYTIGNAEAKVYNLEMQGDLQSTSNLGLFFYDSFLAESRVVILRGEVKDFQRVTNTGVRTVFIDMLAKNNILQYNYGRLIRDVSQRMLMLRDGSIDKAPLVIFRDPLPSDDLERINIATQERALGVVSRQEIATRRGYNWKEQVEEQLEEAEIPLFASPQTQVAKTEEVEPNPKAVDTEVQPR